MKEPTPLAGRARAILGRAAAGELDLRLPTVVVAEIVWTLLSYYGSDREQVADAVIDLLLANGIVAEERTVLLEALRMMKEANVSFVDAYLAEKARAASEPVCSFDKDFERLGVEIISR